MTATEPHATMAGFPPAPGNVPTPKAQRDGAFAAGITSVAIAAAVSSYSGLANLADLAGWNHRLALLLPLTIDAYAMTASRVWLSPKTRNRRARRWAKGNAIGAIATSVAGNAVSHAAAAHVIHVTWPVVVAVSAIPSIVLGLIVHLWHLRNLPDAPEPTAPVAVLSAPPASKPQNSAPTARRAATGTRTAKRPSKPADGKSLSDDELLDAGRLLAAELGQVPSTTRMRKRLGIGTDRARRLATVLAAEHVPTDPAPQTPDDTQDADPAN